MTHVYEVVCDDLTKCQLTELCFFVFLYFLCARYLLTYLNSWLADTQN